MKNILTIFSGDVARVLFGKILGLSRVDTFYEVILSEEILKDFDKDMLNNMTNIKIHNFDPTSYFKLSAVLSSKQFSQVVISNFRKDETVNIVKNIRKLEKNASIVLYDRWNIQIKEDENIQYIRALNILSNSIFQKLPNIPKVAQNIGLGIGEIMEITIPFGSKFAYRYIRSIKQRRWQITALYRDEKLVIVQPFIMIKPNDIIIMTGEPKVLSRMSNIILRNKGQFPVPYGKNLYLYLDMFKSKFSSCLNLAKKAKQLKRKLSETKLYIKITNPTTFEQIKKIKDIFDNNNQPIYNIDFEDSFDFEDIGKDIELYDIGLFVTDESYYQNIDFLDTILEKNIPLFISGTKDLDKTQKCVVVPNEDENYRQIASLFFDISSQFKKRLNIYNMNPYGSDKHKDFIDYLSELSITYNQEIDILSNEQNPIRYLQQEQNILHILPTKKALFKRKISNIFSTDTDILSFKIKKHNKILIPTVEDQDEI